MSEQHPLVCRFGAFGDMVMITPMLKRIYDRGGMPCDVVAIGGWNKSLFLNMPYVRNVYTIKSRKTPFFLSKDKQQLARTLRRQHYHYAWICELQKPSYTLMRKSGIDLEAAVTAIEHGRLAGEHYTQQWLRLADKSPGEFGYPPADEQIPLNTELFVTDEEVTECRQWLNALSIDDQKPLVCIQAGNKRTMHAGKVQRASNTKYWHQKNWAKVIDHIVDEIPDTQVLLCGVPAEFAMTQDIFDLCQHKKNIHLVANELPLRRLLALLSISHSCVSVDTGPAHAAAALDCPVTVLFGKADARLCSPLSSESKVIQITGRIPECDYDLSPESWADCHDIKLIKVEEVIDGWHKCID